MNTSKSIGFVLNALAAESSTSAISAEASARATLRAPAVSTPGYVRVLVAVSAWLAALLLLAFLSMAHWVTNASGAIVAGVVLLPAALLLRRTTHAEFAVQLALAVSLAAQALLIGGVGMLNHSIAAAAFAALLVQALLMALYPDKLQRLLAVLIAVAAVQVLLVEAKFPNGVHLLTVAVAAGAAYVWLNEARLAAGVSAPLYRPIGYGLVIALFGLLVPSLLDAATPTGLAYPLPWISALGLIAVLVFLELRLLRRHAPSFTDIRVLAVLGATALLAIPSLQAPGLLAALIVLLLGFRRGNRLLLGLAFAFFSFFLSAYYYHLPISLLHKSAVLAGSGLILLGLRTVLGRLPGAKLEGTAHA